LLAWYSLILAVVIATFAGIVGVLLWRSMTADLDVRLQAGAASLVQGLRPAGDGEFNLDLPIEYQPADAAGAATPFYYSVWNAERELVDRSPVPFDIPVPDGVGGRTRDGRRELTVHGAGAALVLVGVDMAEARAAVQAFAGTAAIGGLAALLVSMVGGWFLIGRALAPVGRINRAAAAMAGGDLGARIAVERTENELEHVAHALNGAFDRLHRALDSQQRFTADASHELRTPLATLSAETEWALARPRSPEQYRQSLLTCQRATARMERLVTRLLTLARADHDAIDLDRTAVSLDAIVLDAVSLVEPLALHKRVTIATRLDAVGVDGDRERLTELVTNLCANAVEYNRGGGRVAVELWIENGEACLRVRDTGVGISEDDLPRIFERFYRPDRARNRQAGGTGLGLAIAKWIVEAHGGRISCESCLGVGTDMLVRLPGGLRRDDSQGGDRPVVHAVAANLAYADHSGHAVAEVDGDRNPRGIDKRRLDG
jgi:heavy metal sensor kinase